MKGILGLILLVSVIGCASGQPKTATSETPQGSATTCGVATDSRSEALLNVGDLVGHYPPPLERSGGEITRFRAAQCEAATGRSMPTAKCDLAEFPWPVSVASQNVDMYARGADEISQAVFRQNGKPILREVILKAAPGSQLINSYRNHIATCAGVEVATLDGKPFRFTFTSGAKGAIEISDQWIIMLSSYDDPPKDELMAKAIAKLQDR